MANCGNRCPYHWHDSDCEYCSIRDNEVIDLKNYSYDTCPYYQEYRQSNQSGQSNQPSSGSGSGGSGGGCLGCLGLIIIVAIIVWFFNSAFPLLEESLHSTGSTVSSADTARTEPPAEEEMDVSGEEADISGEESDISGKDLLDQGFIFPNSDLDRIDQREIEVLSDRDLTYAINEIYARHGYIFRSDELREYYEQFDWYAGKIPSAEFSDSNFNQTELQNLALLVGERDKRKASG